MDAAEDVVSAFRRQPERDALARLLGPRVEIKSRVEDAHIVCARVLIEDCQWLTGSANHMARRELLVALADDSCSPGRSSAGALRLIARNSNPRLGGRPWC